MRFCFCCCSTPSHALLCVAVQLREVLEKFLDDDSDMKDMNLTAKQEEELALMQRLLMRASTSATPLDVPMHVHSVALAEVRTRERVRAWYSQRALPAE